MFNSLSNIQIGIAFLGTTPGTIIALLSALLLLLRVAAGVGFRDRLPLTLPLSAGVLIASFHFMLPGEGTGLQSFRNFSR